MKRADIAVIRSDRRRYGHLSKPGLGGNFFRGLMLGFPLSSVIWAGIIYAATRLAR